MATEVQLDVTVPSIRLRLAEEEKTAVTAIAHPDVSPSVWVLLGLELEELQYGFFSSFKLLADVI